MLGKGKLQPLMYRMSFSIPKADTIRTESLPLDESCFVGLRFRVTGYGELRNYLFMMCSLIQSYWSGCNIHIPWTVAKQNNDIDLFMSDQLRWLRAVLLRCCGCRELQACSCCFGVRGDWENDEFMQSWLMVQIAMSCMCEWWGASCAANIVQDIM